MSLASSSNPLSAASFPGCPGCWDTAVSAPHPYAGEGKGPSISAGAIHQVVSEEKRGMGSGRRTRNVRGAWASLGGRYESDQEGRDVTMARVSQRF